jgi:hypothetical protein
MLQLHTVELYRNYLRLEGHPCRRWGRPRIVPRDMIMPPGRITEPGPSYHYPPISTPLTIASYESIDCSPGLADSARLDTTLRTKLPLVGDVACLYSPATAAFIARLLSLGRSVCLVLGLPQLALQRLIRWRRCGNRKRTLPRRLLRRATDPSSLGHR